MQSAVADVLGRQDVATHILDLADVQQDYLYTARVCQAWWRAHLQAICWSAPPDLLFKDRHFYTERTKAYGRTLIRAAVTSLSRYEYALQSGLEPDRMAYSMGCFGSDEVFTRYGSSSLACVKGAAAAGNLGRLRTWRSQCVGRNQQFYDELLWTAAEAGHIAVLEHVIKLRDARFDRDSLRRAMGMTGHAPENASAVTLARLQTLRTLQAAVLPDLALRQPNAALKRLVPPNTHRGYTDWTTVPLTLAAVKGGHTRTLEWLHEHHLLPLGDAIIRLIIAQALEHKVSATCFVNLWGKVSDVNPVTFLLIISLLRSGQYEIFLF